MNSNKIPIIKVYLTKNLYDPLIGQESLTTVDIVGVLAGHLLFGVAATLLIDWSWIPLSKHQRNYNHNLSLRKALTEQIYLKMQLEDPIE